MNADQSHPPAWICPAWIAHRGAGQLAPENTRAAFERGAARGYTAFECDVKLSRDGVLFLLHDDDLLRTTNGQGQAADYDWADLSKLDAGAWHSAAHAGEPLMRLDTLLALADERGWWLNLEIKPNPGEAVKTALALAQALRHHGGPLLQRVLLSSFEYESIRALRQLPATSAGGETGWPCALLWDGENLPGLRPDASGAAGLIELAHPMRCVAVVLDHNLIQPDTAALAHRRGLRLLAYTVNDPDRAALLRRQGLDGVITDAVDVFAPA
ncbi:glycerophosphodiester phosphodiesterase family protein [Amphibiibacter pelophylacis]|uniref:Glycerophosphodiester phosphodiesterase family protein n=1 Tax=Amphibiibacter pelophylacis TaxID=1799477 RepID=A0ACC6P584_9BURK